MTCNFRFARHDAAVLGEIALMPGKIFTKLAKERLSLPQSIDTSGCNSSTWLGFEAPAPPVACSVKTRGKPEARQVCPCSSSNTESHASTSSLSSPLGSLLQRLGGSMTKSLGDPKI